MPDSREITTSDAVVIITSLTVVIISSVAICWFILKKIISSVGTFFLEGNDWEKSSLSLRKDKFERMFRNKEVHVIETKNEWDSILPRLMRGISHYKILGIDCEWKPIREKGKPVGPVTLLQLATLDGLCILIRIHKFVDIPQSLKYLLSNKNIIKVGVAILHDADKLKRDYDITVNRCADLMALAKQSDKYNFRGKFGLQNLAKEVLGVYIEKGVVQQSNWGKDVLSYRQREYAALDALAGAHIFKQFVEDKHGNVDRWCDVVSRNEYILI